MPEETSSVAVTRLTRFVRQTAFSLASVALSTSALVLLAIPRSPATPEFLLALAIAAAAAGLVDFIRRPRDDSRAFVATVALCLALVAVITTGMTAASLVTCRVCS